MTVQARLEWLLTSNLKQVLKVGKALRWASTLVLTASNPVMKILHLACRRNSADTMWTAHHPLSPFPNVTERKCIGIAFLPEDQKERTFCLKGTNRLSATSIMR